MAAELVETSRLFARTVARIQPEWVEPLAEHLVKRTYSEPYWSAKHGAAMVKEKVLLYGMTLVADRPVLLGRLGDTPIGDVTAAELAREMFIRHALVGGEWRTHHQFYARNRDLLAEAAEYEARARRRDLVIDEDGLFAFYDERLPDVGRLRPALRRLVEEGPPGGPGAAHLHPRPAGARRPARSAARTSPTPGTRATSPCR